jgi:hypothetical protein
MSSPVGGDQILSPPFATDGSWEPWRESDVELHWTPNHEELVAIKDRIGDDFDSETFVYALGFVQQLPDQAIGHNPQGEPYTRADIVFFRYSALEGAEDAKNYFSHQEAEQQALRHQQLQHIGEEINRIALQKFNKLVNFGGYADKTAEAWPLAEAEAKNEVVTYLLREEERL